MAARPTRPRLRLKGPNEHQIQQAVFEWANLACRSYPELLLLYAVPNGGKRSIRAAAYMKSEGMKAGVPDVCLPVPRQNFGALYIEHKAEDGRLTPAQELWIERLSSAGNKVVVSRSFAQSRDEILCYLEDNESRAPAQRGSLPAPALSTC